MHNKHPYANIPILSLQGTPVTPGKIRFFYQPYTEFIVDSKNRACHSRESSLSLQERLSLQGNDYSRLDGKIGVYSRRRNMLLMTFEQKQKRERERIERHRYLMEIMISIVLGQGLKKRKKTIQYLPTSIRHLIMYWRKMMR